jgi:hypothetical protein
MKAVPYASAIESLMYAQACTCPDLAFVTGMLVRYQKNPGKPHRDEVKKALKYLQDTKYLILMYKKSDAPFEIVGYSDSNFVSCLNIEKSTSWYIFTLADRDILWKSSKQIVTTLLTMYAEFVACYEATMQAEWFKKFVPELRVVGSN